MKTTQILSPLFALLAASFFAAAVSHADDTTQPTAPYTVQKTFPIGGEGRWDYATFDPASNRVYVTRSTHTQGIDITTGQVVADIPGQKHAHGVAIATAAGRGFITDNGTGVIQIFDLKTNQMLGQVPAADDADGLIFDAGTNKVLATCGDAGKLAVLASDADPKTAKADLIDLGGKPEFLAADGQGKAYVNLNDVSKIAVVDLASKTVTATWPTGTGTEPTGLAIDPAHHLLFIGCGNRKMVIMSTQDGHVVAELPIGKGNDACAFDPSSGTAFASCGGGTLAVVTQDASGNFTVANIPTRPGARTMTVDPATHIAYLPTAEFDPATLGARRPTPKPGTFMVVVVAPTPAK